MFGFGGFGFGIFLPGMWNLLFIRDQLRREVCEGTFKESRLLAIR
jgi:hypothetical protein